MMPPQLARAKRRNYKRSLFEEPPSLDARIAKRLEKRETLFS